MRLVQACGGGLFVAVLLLLASWQKMHFLFMTDICSVTIFKV